MLQLELIHLVVVLLPPLKNSFWLPFYHLVENCNQAILGDVINQ